MTKFVISTSKFGVDLGSFEFDTEALSEAQRDWAIANGFNQALTDCHASDTEKEHVSKEKAIEEAKKSVAAWVKKMQEGHVPSSGGGGKRVSDLEKELREQVTTWAHNVFKFTKTDVRKECTAKGCEAYVRELAEGVATAKGVDANEIFAPRWAALLESANLVLAARATVKEATPEF